MRRALAIACGFLLLAVAVPAGTAVRVDVPALVAGADLAIEARVLSMRAILAPGGRIDTEYELAVERTFVGEALASRSIRLPGGVLPDGRGMAVPGLPRLAVGERAILFLSRADATGMRMSVGLAQGRFRIEQDAAGRKRLARDQAGLELLDPRTGKVAPADASASFDYAEVVAAIEAAAARRMRERERGR